MDYYIIETKKGRVKCYEVKGVYYPVDERDNDRFLYEQIVSIERIEPDA
jgi:hypothetical protein